MTRHLVLFAREPAHEARRKGFASEEAGYVFGGFASGWLEAAVRSDARFVVAAPAEDLAAWRRRLPDDGRVAWMVQCGRSFGERLEKTAARLAREGGHAVLVGGDAAPDSDALVRAFQALEKGADAVLAPAPDGGVSLVALSASDHDLLGGISIGGRCVFRDLVAALDHRGRRVEILALVPDVDGREDLRRLLRSADPILPRSILRRALAIAPLAVGPELRPPRALRLAGPSGLRAPPAFA